MSIEKFKIKCTTGESFELRVPPPGGNKSFFAFSLPKAGSTLLEKVMTDVCAKKSIPVISPCQVAFQLGLNPTTMTDDLEQVFHKQGYGYLGFRHYLPFDSVMFDMNEANHLLLVRDPRDMLTSLYFSMKFSHTIPKAEGRATKVMVKARQSLEEKTIDNFVLERSEGIMKIYRRYIYRLIPLDNVKVYRYEDIIFDKVTWVKSMLDFIGEELPEKDVISIAKKHDLRPSEENPLLHVRQVTPGNYKKHLAEETIDRLNETFTNVLNHFSYDT